MFYISIGIVVLIGLLIFCSFNTSNITLFRKFEVDENSRLIFEELAIFKSYFYNNILFPNDNLFTESVVLANYACHLQCPTAVFRPINETEISAIVRIAESMSLGLVIKGGGHSYTCQSTKGNRSVMIDLRYLNHLELNIRKFNSSTSSDYESITLGAGNTWQKVLNFLDNKPYRVKPKVSRTNLNDSYITVHGQCTEVGVAGFSLHGGVHFGGLSELYGLSADNILGLTAVLANSSVVKIKRISVLGIECSLDGKIITRISDISLCRGLFYAFRGAGSSFGIVTSLTLRIYQKPLLLTALSVLSIDINSDPELDGVQIIENFLYDYLHSWIPQDKISITLFGLDAYFKAYSFLQRFSNKHSFKSLFNSLNYNPSSMYVRNFTKRNNPRYVHFVIEASWLSTVHSDNIEDDSLYKLLQDVHLKLSKNVSWNEYMRVRQWLPSAEMWSVPSYEMVWGRGHSFGGASVIVGETHFRRAIRVTLTQYSSHVKSHACDDCVVVLHRVGAGLRKNRDHCDFTHNGVENDLCEDTNVTQHSDDSYHTSFHPFRHNATLWLEMDCATFHRNRDRFGLCKSFLHTVQSELDHAVASRLNNSAAEAQDESSQYPNVPSLDTLNWQSQYYGKVGYNKLVEIKNYWDPHNMFSHVQSIGANTNTSVCQADIPIQNITFQQKRCKSMYDNNAFKPIYKIILVVCVTMLCVLIRSSALPSSNVRLMKRIRRRNKKAQSLFFRSN